MRYSECVNDDEYYLCPSDYGDASKTSCCVDSYGGGQCCVPETVEELWAGNHSESPMIFYLDYLLIFGASVVLLVIMGLLCCEYADWNGDEDNSYLIKQRSLTPEIKISHPHEYNGNNFRVIREYNRQSGTIPSAPPSYYEEFDNGISENYNTTQSMNSNMPVHGRSNWDSSCNQKSFVENNLDLQYQFESTPSCSNCYRPASYAPRRSPSFFNWS